MTLVKIDRSSIRPNPKAGDTLSWMQGPKSASFRFRRGGKIPANLLNKVVITEWQGLALPEDAVHLAGLIENPDEWQLFSKIEGIEIEVDNGLQKFHHAPEPEYLYRYENPAIPCSNCHEAQFLSEIAFEYDDNGNEYATCPHCGEINTFEIEYQSLAQTLANSE